MEISNFKLELDEYEKILFILSSLHERFKADSIFLINRNGQTVGQVGETDGLDVQSLASLAASNLAATFGLARLIGEREFAQIFHQGDSSSILINPVGEFALLLVIIQLDRGMEVDSKSLRQASLILEDILRKCNERTKNSDE